MTHLLRALLTLATSQPSLLPLSVTQHPSLGTLTELFLVPTPHPLLHNGIQTQGRVGLHRGAKSKAITAINALTSATPSNAYRIPSIVDCPSVEVSIAESTLEDAGLGLFLTMGPSADGSAPPGTLLATYSGVTLTSPADRARVTSRGYKSDYLFEGLNPFNNTITIIDASNPRSSYGRYSNDSVTFAEANAEFVFGKDGTVYLRALTTIPQNGEIFVNYGSHYWTDPDRWPHLSEPLRLAILQYYACEAPLLPHVPGLGNEMMGPTEAIGPPKSYPAPAYHPHSPDATPPLVASPDSPLPRHLGAETEEPKLSLPRDRVMFSVSPPSSLTPPPVDLQPLRSARRLRPLPRDHHRFEMVVDPADRRDYGYEIRKCFGTSVTGNTRISFPYLEPNDFALTVITNSLGSLPFRAQAPETLRSILSSRHFIKLQYWKKADRSLYYETPLCGACGHYVLAQVHSRQYDNTNQLQLGTSRGRQRAAEILEALAQEHLLTTVTGQDNLEHTIQWIRSTSDLINGLERENCLNLSGEDFYMLSRGRLDVSLFGQIPPDRIPYTLSMPDDDHREWLQLFSSSACPIAAGLSLQEILEVSEQHAVQHSGSHYWLSPWEPEESLHCRQALDELALSIWDRMRDVPTPQVDYPSGSYLQLPLLSLILSPPSDPAWLYPEVDPLTVPVLTSVSNGTTSSALAATVPTLLPSVDIRRCFGCSKDDATRLSLPLLALDAPEISLISSLLSSPSRAQAPGVLRQLLSLQDNIPLKYWKKQDRALYYVTPPDGACGYYALAQVSHLRSRGTLLNLDSSTGRQEASTILHELSLCLHLFYHGRSSQHPACHRLDPGKAQQITGTP